MNLETARVAVIGLGYVGLPLAVEFGKQRPTIGFDVNARRIEELERGHDHTREVTAEELRSAAQLCFESDSTRLTSADTFIVTVPTPIDNQKRPDLSALRAASRTVGAALSPGGVVIYESTVYPGATEEVCIPIIEEVSGLVFNQDFFAGYSPERINPGDKAHRLADIKKVTAGSTPDAADFVDALYREVVRAGTHRAGSIRVAEAAKVIENTQRDLNIALVNELAVIFNRLGIDTQEVLEAAGTKWNFLPFRPGLVGGHCIGVDPYYLTYKAEEIGHHPEVILAGRRINDGMGRYIAGEIVKLMIRARCSVADARILVLGLAFKENCPDLRNTGVVDIVREFRDYGATVEVYDPWVDGEEAEREYGIRPLAEPADGYDVVILAVAHDLFTRLGAAKLRALGRQGCILYDIKSALPKGEVDGRL